MSSYFVAFSNDSQDWTTLHDSYAEWVSGDRVGRTPVSCDF